MTSLSRTPSAPLSFTPADSHGTPLALNRRQLIYTRLRQTAAMSSGLEALATRAIDDGEATPEQLDHIAELSGHLTEQLSYLSRLFMELTGEPQ